MIPIHFIQPPCSRRRNYVFYSAFAFTRDGIYRKYKIHEFHLVESNGNIRIAEIVLLAECVSTGYRCVRLLLYVLPEDSPTGRQLHHGRHEVFSDVAERTVSLENFIAMLAEGIDWPYGYRVNAPSRFGVPGVDTIVDEVIYDESLFLFDKIIVLTFSKYCRFLTIAVRLHKGLLDYCNTVEARALGVPFDLDDIRGRTVHILFCRNSYIHAEDVWLAAPVPRRRICDFRRPNRNDDSLNDRHSNRNREHESREREKERRDSNCKLTVPPIRIALPSTSNTYIVSPAVITIGFNKNAETTSITDSTRPSTSRKKILPESASSCTKMNSSATSDNCTSTTSHKDINIPTTSSHEDINIPTTSSHEDINIPTTSSHEDINIPTTSSHEDINIPTTSSYEDINIPTTSSHEDINIPTTSSHEDINIPATSSHEDINIPLTSSHEDINVPTTSSHEDINIPTTSSHEDINVPTTSSHEDINVPTTSSHENINIPITSSHEDINIPVTSSHEDINIPTTSSHEDINTPSTSICTDSNSEPGSSQHNTMISTDIKTELPSQEEDTILPTTITEITLVSSSLLNGNIDSASTSTASEYEQDVVIEPPPKKKKPAPRRRRRRGGYKRKSKYERKSRGRKQLKYAKQAIKEEICIDDPPQQCESQINEIPKEQTNPTRTTKRGPRWRREVEDEDPDISIIEEIYYTPKLKRAAEYKSKSQDKQPVLERVTEFNASPVIDISDDTPMPKLENSYYGCGRGSFPISNQTEIPHVVVKQEVEILTPPIPTKRGRGRAKKIKNQVQRPFQESLQGFPNFQTRSDHGNLNESSKDASGSTKKVKPLYICSSPWLAVKQEKADDSYDQPYQSNSQCYRVEPNYVSNYKVETSNVSMNASSKELKVKFTKSTVKSKPRSEETVATTSSHFVEQQQSVISIKDPSTSAVNVLEYQPVAVNSNESEMKKSKINARSSESRIIEQQLESKVNALLIESQIMEQQRNQSQTVIQQSNGSQIMEMLNECEIIEMPNGSRTSDRPNVFKIERPNESQPGEHPNEIQPKDPPNKHDEQPNELQSHEQPNDPQTSQQPNQIAIPVPNCSTGASAANNASVSNNNPQVRNPIDRFTEDRVFFYKNLFKFMFRRNTPIQKVPFLDLYYLFKRVHFFGGYEEVTKKRMWKSMYDEIGGDPGSTNAAFCTRRHYEHLVLPFEKHLAQKYKKPPRPGRFIVGMRGEPVFIKQEPVDPDDGNAREEPLDLVNDLFLISTEDDDEPELNEVYFAAIAGCTSRRDTTKSPKRGKAKTCKRKSTKPRKLCTNKPENSKIPWKKMPPKKRYDLTDEEQRVAEVLSIISQNGQPQSNGELQATSSQTVPAAKTRKLKSEAVYPVNCNQLNGHSGQVNYPPHSERSKNLPSATITSPSASNAAIASREFPTTSRSAMEMAMSSSRRAEASATAVSQNLPFMPHFTNSVPSAAVSSNSVPSGVPYASTSYQSSGSDYQVKYKEKKMKAVKSPKAHNTASNGNFVDKPMTMGRTPQLGPETDENSPVPRPSVILHTEQIVASPPPLSLSSSSSVCPTPQERDKLSVWSSTAFHQISLDSPFFSSKPQQHQPWKQTEKAQVRKPFYDPITKTLHEIHLGNASSSSYPPVEIQPPKKRFANRRVGDTPCKKDDKIYDLLAEANVGKTERKVPTPKAQGPRSRQPRQNKSPAAAATTGRGRAYNRQQQAFQGSTLETENILTVPSIEVPKPSSSSSLPAYSMPLVLSSPYISSLSRSVHMTFKASLALRNRARRSKVVQNGARVMDLSIKPVPPETHRNRTFNEDYQKDCLDLSIKKNNICPTEYYPTVNYQPPNFGTKMNPLTMALQKFTSSDAIARAPASSRKRPADYPSHSLFNLMQFNEPQVAPRISPQMPLQVSPQMPPQVSPQMSLQISPRNPPRISPQIPHQISPQLSPQISPQLSPQVPPQVSMMDRPSTSSLNFLQQQSMLYGLPRVSSSSRRIDHHQQKVSTPIYESHMRVNMDMPPMWPPMLSPPAQMMRPPSFMNMEQEQYMNSQLFSMYQEAPYHVPRSERM